MKVSVFEKDILTEYKLTRPWKKNRKVCKMKLRDLENDKNDSAEQIQQRQMVPRNAI